MRSRAEVVERGEVLDLPRPQAVGQVELRPRLEPVREVVPLAVVPDALGRDGPEHLLEALQVGGTPDLRPVGQAEDEVAEAEVPRHEVPQLVQEERRLLQREGGAGLPGESLVLGPGRLEHDRHVGRVGLDPARQLHPGERLERAVARELDVGDHSEDVLVVAREGVPGLLPGPAEEDLRAGPQAQQLLREVDPLRHERVRVTPDLRVDDRKERGVVADAVLDEEDRLHARLLGVVRDVPAVLDELDDREEDPHVALPEEDAVQLPGVVAGREVGQRARVVGEERHRGPPSAELPDSASELERAHVADVEGRDDEVEVRLDLEEREGLRSGRDARDARDVSEVQLLRLGEDPLVELAVLGEDEGVVQAGDDEDVVDPVGHEPLESAPLGRGRGRRGAGRCRGHRSPPAGGARVRSLPRGRD